MTYARHTPAILIACLLSCFASRDVAAQSEVTPLLRCQKTFAIAGARFANKTIKGTLKCTNEIVECQINCDEGTYGPSCISNPLPCCDSDDPESNEAFGACMDDAADRCVIEAAKIAAAEESKRSQITKRCSQLTTEELCGSQTPGLNYVMLNAGCEALIPGYQCSLTALLDCVGGPREQALSEQIAGLLDPRSGDGLSAAGINSTFAGIAKVFKVRGTLPAGRADVYAINGKADDRVTVSVRTLSGPANSPSSLAPVLTYIGNDASTPVGDTTVLAYECPAASTCGATCPQFTRTFPFNGTFYLAVEASTAAGCGGGEYQLVVATESGFSPSLVADDAVPPATP